MKDPRFDLPSSFTSTASPLSGRSLWLTVRAVVVVGFFAYGWLQGFKLAVLFGVLLIGPLTLLYWLRGGQWVQVHTTVVEPPPDPGDFGPTEQQKMSDPAYSIYAQNVNHEHKNVWKDYH